MVKVILTHLGCFDLKPLLTDPPHKSSNWFCHCQPQPLCKDSESKLKLFHAARVADSQQSWKHFLMLMISASDLLLMGCTPAFMSDGGWALSHILRKFWSLQIILFALVFLWHLLSLYVALLLKSLILWFWLCCEAVNWLGFATVQQQSTVTAATQRYKCD